MPQVIQDLKQGKPIQLSYRHRVIGILQPVDTEPGALRRGSPEAIRRSLQGLQSLSVPLAVSRDKRSIKEQIAELRDKRRG